MVDDSGAMLLPADEPPKSGEWVDVHDILANPTQEELEAGLEDGLTVTEEFPALDWLRRPQEATATALATTAAGDFANRLAQHIRSYAGVQVSVELVVGRPTSLTSDDWYCPLFQTNFGHHTVSRYSSSNLTPVLALCKKGRSDVPGPLCNGYGGYDLTYRIICAGLANHPGAGGPFKVTRTGLIIPQDSARPYAWGTEWEGGLSESDWTRTLRNPRTGQTMPMYEFMGRVDAAINTFKGWPKGEFWVADQLEHKTWTTRKRDRDYKSRAWFQDNARKYTKTTPTPPPPPPPTEEDLPVNQAAFNELFDNWVITRATAKKQWDAAVAAAEAAGKPAPAMSTAARAGGMIGVLPWWQRLGKGPLNMHGAMAEVLSEVREADTDIAALQEDVDALLQPEPPTP